MSSKLLLRHIAHMNDGRVGQVDGWRNFRRHMGRSLFWDVIDQVGDRRRVVYDGGIEYKMIGGDMVQSVLRHILRGRG